MIDPFAGKFSGFSDRLIACVFSQLFQKALRLIALTMKKLKKNELIVQSLCGVVSWCARVVVGGFRPQVALVVANMHPQSPGGQIERVAAGCRYIVCRDPLPGQIVQVRCVELHLAYVCIFWPNLNTYSDPI